MSKCKIFHGYRGTGEDPEVVYDRLEEQFNEFINNDIKVIDTSLSQNRLLLVYEEADKDG